METLWARHPLTAREVISKLQGEHAWKGQTIRTMLGRLVGKGALDFRSEGRAYQYSPAVRREDCVRREGRSFMRRVLRSAAAPVLVQMVKETKLSREDIAELKRILTEKEKRI